MGDITTASGSLFYIGPTPASTVDTANEYAALSYTEIGLIESLGEFGDEASDVSFASIGDARVRHSKGARDAGTMTVTCAHDPYDAGQLAANAAEATNNNYAFKLVIPDGATTSSTDTAFYFKGMVRSKKLNVGSNDSVIKRTYQIGINSEIFEVVSTTF